MQIKLEIPVKPMAHQSVRVTRTGRTYQPKKVSTYKSQIQEVVREQLPDDFSVIKADTQIHIKQLHYIFEYPKAMSKKKRNEPGIKYKHTKPDLHDNLNKALFDALEGVVWERDQNVVSIDNLKKYYEDTNKILITIEC